LIFAVGVNSNNQKEKDNTIICVNVAYDTSINFFETA
jgi:hypothetical protein